MQKSRTIQLNIDSPCHEDWNAMIAEGRGRFCGQCQKTVIDFTTWSDADLFNFFARPATGHVCGRFFRTQLQKQLHIPSQPKSRLYRIAIACGLTLMFAQVPEIHAMVKQPVELLSTHENNDGDKNEDSKNTGGIKGKIVDEYGNAIKGATVDVTINSKKVAGAITNDEGRYMTKGLSAGKYVVSSIYPSGNTVVTVRVTEQKVSTANLSIKQFEPPIMGDVIPGPVIQGGIRAVPEPPATPPPVPSIEKREVKVK